jgi:hypothetical protein
MQKLDKFKKYQQEHCRSLNKVAQTAWNTGPAGEILPQPPSKKYIVSPFLKAWIYWKSVVHVVICLLH